MIKCSKCAAMICMKFHSELTPSSHKELTRIYRKKLATSHKDTCAFSMDAKRWLIMNEIESDREENGSNDTQDTTVTMVPPYLIPMSKEFFMLHCTDISEYSSVTAKDYIGKEAERLCKALQQFDVHLSLPDQVTDRIISICGDAIGNSATRSSRQDLSRHQLQEIFRTENHDENESNLNLQCILLALFGWRLDSPEHDDEAAEGNNNQRVTCSMCLNSQLCCAISQSSPASKRQRTEGGSTSNHPSKQSFEFDLINSHRYFCPVVCGFVKKDDENGKNGTSQPCWEVILSSICRGRGVTSARNGSAENAEKDQNRKAFDGDGLLQKVRKTLRSPMLKVQGSLEWPST